MSRKTRRAYEHLFKYLKKNIIDLENGASIMTDFECAMRNALRAVFPGIELNCCWFHFTQAAKKRAMQTPQLIPYLLQNTKAREIYYKLLSLPLLPPKDIIPQFQRLKVLALAKNKSVFADFIKYYEKQWIKKVCNIAYGIKLFTCIIANSGFHVAFRKVLRTFQSSINGPELRGP